MKFLKQSPRRVAGSWLATAATALLAVAMSGTVGSVHATQSVAAPLAPPSVIGTVFIGDTTANILLRSNGQNVGIRTEAEKVSGPGTQTFAVVTNSDVIINGVSPANDYVFRVRRVQFFDVVKNKPTNIVSAWTTVSFRTPPLFAGERPGAPVIVRGANSNGNFVINITAPPATSTTPQASFRYVYRVNGGPALAVCSGGAYTCLTVQEQTTLIQPLPATGTSIRITVQALDNNGYTGATSNEIVVQ